MAPNPRPPRPNMPGASRHLAPGARVGNAGYTLKRLLGRGGLGEVWLAWERKLERDVALKILPQSLLQDANLIEALKTETARTQQLVHPAIARVFDFVHDYETVAIAMEHIDGWPLAALKVDRPHKRYRFDEILPWIRQACEALEYAHHEVCLVHRDLKPSNFLLDSRDQIKLTDFGTAHSISSALAQRGHLVYGAIAYMSPQQVQGAEASILDDVYSLAATIYDLLTGTPPFYTGDILLQVRELPPASLNERLAELKIQDTIPANWEKTIAACLAKNPEHRPQSTLEVLRLLEAPAGTRAAAPGHTPGAAAPKPEIASEVPKASEVLPAEDPNDVEIEPDPATISVVHIDEAESPQPTPSSEALAEPRPFRLPVDLRDRRILVGAGFVVLLLLGLVFWRPTGSKAREPKMTGPPGSVDSSFKAGTGADNEIRSISILKDGRILLGGRFTNFAGAAVKGLARLTAEGLAETNFLAATSGTVHAIVTQADQKIVVGGDFTKMNGETRRRIARLQPDGSLDTSFDPKQALNREARAILVQPDGKIVVGGSFDGSSGNRHNRITRLNADGSKDGTFNPGAGANSIISALALQPDGKIIAAGDFTRFDNSLQGRVVRINSNGTLDPSFQFAKGANAAVLALFLQPDGKILLGGNFTTVDGAPSERIARLQPNGSVDAAFKPESIPKGGVRSIVLEPSGAMLIGGSFSSVGALVRNGVARMAPNGALDRGFDPGYGTTDGSVWNLGLQPSGKVVVVGSFKKFNGTVCGRIVCLNGDS